MKWLAWRLVYELQSPLHVGVAALGYIRLTRRYVPARTMWGAMTAMVAKTHGNGSSADYVRFGQLVQNDLRPSYFFVATEPGDPLIPVYTPEGVCYGAPRISAVDFEKRFVGSFAQTALDAHTLTAEQAALHESEYIGPLASLPSTPEPQLRPVYLVGYVFAPQGAKLPGSIEADGEPADHPWFPALRHLFVGGDRKYGWGRMQLWNRPAAEGPQQHVFNCQFLGDREYPAIRLPAQVPVPGHLAMDCPCRVRGDLEPLVGRAWTHSSGTVAGMPSPPPSGPGQKVVGFDVCWAPGSIAEGDLLLQFQPEGTLKGVSNAN